MNVLLSDCNAGWRKRTLNLRYGTRQRLVKYSFTLQLVYTSFCITVENTSMRVITMPYCSAHPYNITPRQQVILPSISTLYSLRYGTTTFHFRIHPYIHAHKQHKNFEKKSLLFRYFFILQFLLYYKLSYKLHFFNIKIY